MQALGPAVAALALGSPYAAEDFSPLTGSGLLVVDFRDFEAAELLDDDRGAHGRRATAAFEDGPVAPQLMHLPCPTVALVGSDKAVEAPALDRFDTVVDVGADLERIAATARRMPIASTALVQLLRHGRTLDLHEALIAESLVYSTLQAGPEFRRWLEEEAPAGAELPEDRASPVLVERCGERLDIRFNRPDRHNAFNAAARDALCEALTLALGDDSIEEVVLSGQGDSFCSGGDLQEFGTLPDPATAHLVRSTRHAGRMIAALGKRIRVEVHGASVGAGIELPAFASHVSADSNAFFCLPELSLGLVPGAGGTASIPRRIGHRRTAWMALTGRRVDPTTALAWGLIDEKGGDESVF